MSKVAFGCVDRKKGPYCFDVFRSRDQYMISFFEERKCSSARTGSGCQTCLTGRGGECRDHIPPSFGILSHTRDNPATNPWWPPADKHTAVKRYDILSLRGDLVGMCALDARKVYPRMTPWKIIALLIYIIIGRAKIFGMHRRFGEFEFFVSALSQVDYSVNSKFQHSRKINNFIFICGKILKFLFFTQIYFL